MKNLRVRPRYLLITNIILAIMLIVALFGFLNSPESKTPTSAASTSYKCTLSRYSPIPGQDFPNLPGQSTYSVNIYYDNIYGSITSSNGQYRSMTSSDGETTSQILNILNITFSLNAGYSWNASSVEIEIERLLPVGLPIILEFTRSGNTWSFEYSMSSSFPTTNRWALYSDQQIIFNRNYVNNLTFPISSLVNQQPSSITYNLNNGSYGSSHPDEYTPSTSAQTLTISNPSRSGYTFSGWTVSWTDSTHSGTLPTISGTSTTLNIPASTSGNITLTANWTGRSYTISYTLNSGSYGSSHPSSYTVSASARTYTVSKPTRTGYTFSSWRLSRSGTYGGSPPTISGTTLRVPANSYGNIRLTANWTANRYTVYFNSSGYENKVGSAAGFENSGWRNGSYSTTHVRSGSYAYQITGNAGSSESLVYTTSGVSLTSANKDHIFYFQYWGYQDTAVGGTQLYWPEEEPTVGASIPMGPAGQWNMYSFRTSRSGNSTPGSTSVRIDFDNGGVAGTLWVDDFLMLDLTEIFGAGNEPSKEWCDRHLVNVGTNQSMTYGTSANLTQRPATATHEGYDFLGWSTTPKTGSNTQTVNYTNGQSVSNLTSTSNGTVTLYAVWQIRQYNVSVSINDSSLGSVTGAGTYNYGDRVVLTAIPSTALNYFVWWTDTAGMELSQNPVYTIDFLTENISLNAIFAGTDPAIYAINGGEIRMRSDGTNITATATPYAGYAFLGWTTDSGSSLGSTDPIITMPISSLMGRVLIARFAPTGQSTPTGDFGGISSEVLATTTLGGEVRISGYDRADATTIHLSAVASAGYHFTGWTASDGTDLSMYKSTANIPFSLIVGKVITANFAPNSTTDKNPDIDNSGDAFDPTFN